jgi:hypothetical protein
MWFFAVDYLQILYVGHDFKRRSRRISGWSGTGVKAGESSTAKAYTSVTTYDEFSTAVARVLLCEFEFNLIWVLILNLSFSFGLVWRLLSRRRTRKAAHERNFAEDRHLTFILIRDLYRIRREWSPVEGEVGSQGAVCSLDLVCTAISSYFLMSHINWKEKHVPASTGSSPKLEPLLRTVHPATNSIQFFIMYVPSQQLQGQLQTQHNVDTRIIIVVTNSTELSTTWEFPNYLDAR